MSISKMLVSFCSILVFFCLITSSISLADERCGQITSSQAYNKSWEEFKRDATSDTEKSLVKTIDSLERKDTHLLENISHYDKDQADMLFQQLEIIKPTSVSAYYTLNNLGVFYINMSFNGSEQPIDFPFTLENETALFIMDRASYMNTKPYKTLNEWHVHDKNKTLYPCDTAE